MVYSWDRLKRVIHNSQGRNLKMETTHTIPDTTPQAARALGLPLGRDQLVGVFNIAQSHRKLRGIVSGEPTIEQLTNGIPGTSIGGLARAWPINAERAADIVAVIGVIPSSDESAAIVVTAAKVNGVRGTGDFTGDEGTKRRVERLEFELEPLPGAALIGQRVKWGRGPVFWIAESRLLLSKLGLVDIDAEENPFLASALDAIHRRPRGWWTDFGEVAVATGRDRRDGDMLAALLTDVPMPMHQHAIRTPDGRYVDPHGEMAHETEMDQVLKSEGCGVSDRRAAESRKLAWAPSPSDWRPWHWTAK